MKKVLDQFIIQMMKHYLYQVDNNVVKSLSLEWGSEPGESGHIEGSYTEHYDS